MAKLEFKFNTTYDIYKVAPGGKLAKIEGVYILFNQKPFAKGAFRECYLGFLVNKDKKTIKLSEFLSGKCVVKKYKAHCNVQDMAGDYNASYLAFTYAVAFNNIIKVPNKINFVYPCVTADKTTNQYISVEPYIEGSYTKFSSNTGFENPNFSAFIPAFAHYTWLNSKGRFVIMDIQGVFKDNKYYLTDPAIQSVKMEYGSSDLGAMGLIKFILCHKHNDICKNWKWIPKQFNGVLAVFNATSIKRTSFRFEYGKNIEKYTPIYLGLLKYVFG